MEGHWYKVYDFIQLESVCRWRHGENVDGYLVRFNCTDFHIPPFERITMTLYVGSVQNLYLCEKLVNFE